MKNLRIISVRLKTRKIKEHCDSAAKALGIHIKVCISSGQKIYISFLLQGPLKTKSCFKMAVLEKVSNKINKLNVKMVDVVGHSKLVFPLLFSARPYSDIVLSYAYPLVSKRWGVGIVRGLKNLQNLISEGWHKRWARWHSG